MTFAGVYFPSVTWVESRAPDSTNRLGSWISPCRTGAGGGKPKWHAARRFTAIDLYGQSIDLCQVESLGQRFGVKVIVGS